MKRHLCFLLTTAICLLNFSSCTMMERTGTAIVGRSVGKASNDILQESHWNFVHKGLMGELKTVESLLYLRPTDADLLHVLTKGYAAYGFLVSETLLFEEELKGHEDKNHKQEALDAYHKALQFGYRYLEREDMSFLQMMRWSQEGTLLEKLNAKLSSSSSRDQEVIFFLGQALGGLVNLQKDRPTYIAMLPFAKGLFDWVCLKNPDFYEGSCSIFYGVYELGRPALLGGNPDKGKEILESAIKSYPQNLFIRLAYIQYALLPQYESDLIALQIKELTPLVQRFKKEQQEFAFDGEVPTLFVKQQLNIFNATALRRFDSVQQFYKP